MTISITGYPRIVIAKPSTPSACWPRIRPSEYFDNLVNPALSSKHVKCDNETDLLQDDDFYPYLIELSLLSGLYESIQNITMDSSNELSLAKAGARVIRGPRLQNGFGGTDDGDGSVFGVALKTIVDYKNPVSIEFDLSDESIRDLEYGGVGNFGWGETLKALDDFEEYSDCAGLLYGRPGWQIDSEKIFGYRHIFRPSLLNISKALEEHAPTSPLRKIAESLTCKNTDKIEFFSQLIYRYMPKKKSAFQFEYAATLSQLEDLLNGGDMDWAGDNYGYNPDYDY